MIHFILLILLLVGCGKGIVNLYSDSGDMDVPIYKIKSKTKSELLKDIESFYIENEMSRVDLDSITLEKNPYAKKAQSMGVLYFYFRVIFSLELKVTYYLEFDENAPFSLILRGFWKNNSFWSIEGYVNKEIEKETEVYIKYFEKNILKQIK